MGKTAHVSQEHVQHGSQHATPSCASSAICLRVTNAQKCPRVESLSRVMELHCQSSRNPSPQFYHALRQCSAWLVWMPHIRNYGVDLQPQALQSSVTTWIPWRTTVTCLLFTCPFCRKQCGTRTGERGRILLKTLKRIVCKIYAGMLRGFSSSGRFILHINAFSLFSWIFRAWSRKRGHNLLQRITHAWLNVCNGQIISLTKFGCSAIVVATESRAFCTRRSCQP